MPQEYDPRKLPVVNDIPVQQQFVELPEPRFKRPHWRPVVITCVLAAAVYLIFFRDSDKPVVPAATTAVAGWFELGPCAFTTSLDGKELSLLGDGSATILDTSPLKGGETIKDHTTEGQWRFDDSSKRYVVAFNGETIDYLLVSPGKIYLCMLIKGDIDATDLRASWFSSSSDEYPGDDKEPDSGL